MIFLPLDWELLRLSPVPVWLVCGAGTGAPRRVAAAVDPVHPEHGAGALNDAILQNARALTEPGVGTLKVFSAFAGLPPGLAALDPAGLAMAYSHEEIYERMRRDHRTALDTLLARHGLGAESAEMLYGPPAEVLWEAAALFDPDVLVVGSLRRRGLDRLLMGSTVERLIVHAPCDILAVPAQPTTGPNPR
jgi:universal stress protein E